MQEGFAPMPPPTKDVILALPYAPDRVPLATQIRSTVLSSSLTRIDALGLRERYEALMPDEHLQVMRSLIVGQWVPIEVGLAHYGAIDQLGISAAQAHENGRLVAERVQKSHFAMLVRTMGLGITPWTILPRTQSMLDRLMLRAAGSVIRLGPKDARIEVHGAPIARYSYVRLGWAGMIEATFEAIVRKAYCRDVSPLGATTSAALMLTWA